VAGWRVAARQRVRSAQVREDLSHDTKKGVRVVLQRVEQKKKGKGNWGHGRQPRLHAPPPPPVHDRAVKCPCCKQAFVVLIEELPAAFRLKDAARYIGGVSAPTFHRLIQRGLIRPNRAIRHLLFPREELDRFLRDNLSESQ
jgi:hypothetical protein